MSRQLKYLMALLLPVFLHVLLFFISIPWGYTLQRLDEALLLLMIVYIVTAGIFAYLLKKHAIKFLVVTYMTLVCLILLEISLRVFFGNSPLLRYHSIALHNPNLSMQALVTKKINGVDDVVKFTTNSLHLRSPEIRNFSDVDISILCIGGSTTECLPVTDSKTWTALLQKELSKKLDKNVYVGNAGKAAMFTVSHKQVLKNYVHLKNFEWIVILCGINDLATFLRDDYDERSTKQESDAVLYYKKLFLVNLLQALHRQNYATQDLGGYYIENRRLKRKNAKILTEIYGDFDLALRRYRKNLLDIIQICREKNKKLIFMTQPTLWHENMSLDLQGMLWQSTLRGSYTPKILAKMMDDYNNVMLDICDQKKVYCLDLAKSLPKNKSVFYDDCHFNNSGCQKISNILSEYLFEKIE
ncbi:SGNH/GDSL hydrolase family protein [Candidatus Uabimicrobium amorphum]|uniref:SGNH hydrolase-type esterase domain-containing protein n=1 Tax=Uabimicrobium amorphum TaxID=2596890 RepID=A0A5S9F5E2_UABAM|nr:SGNH/GDSL hydrolase family protein [Candidatus Uabimicrobium amorphum]BBM85474.1 hypothetical protein UABAM_03843 [Candidatus Uabimicrobium amorphum]